MVLLKLRGSEAAIPRRSAIADFKRTLAAFWFSSFDAANEHATLYEEMALAVAMAAVRSPDVISAFTFQMGVVSYSMRERHDSVGSDLQTLRGSLARRNEPVL
ncbi:hypothetical protein V5799_009808 [Amblyomma americanum]|uniref:Uncharacterized protein n=1 Tax=Amblyomma americanum TaxID=6943 RepID=A0AAQ4F9C8_AMBAM